MILTHGPMVCAIACRTEESHGLKDSSGEIRLTRQWLMGTGVWGSDLGALGEHTDNTPANKFSRSGCAQAEELVAHKSTIMRNEIFLGMGHCIEDFEF